MIFTPPIVEHCMKFPEDTVFLTLSRNPRDQKTYEADVVRINLIDPSDSISWKPNEMILCIKTRFCCRLCNSSELVSVLKLSIHTSCKCVCYRKVFIKKKNIL